MLNWGSAGPSVPPPHRPPHGAPQRRAAPDVHSWSDQRVQARHDGERVRGFVPKPQTLAGPGQLPDDDVNKGRTPQNQVADDHEHDDAQRLLLSVPVGAGGLSPQLAPGDDVQLHRHDDFNENYDLQNEHGERLELSRLGDGHAVLHDDDEVGVEPRVRANANDHGPRDVAAVEERVADGQVAVELSKEEGEHVDPQEGRQDVEGPVPGRVALLHVEQAQVEDGQARERVADARVEHEDEAVLHAQGPGAGDPHEHGAGHEHGTGGEQEVEGEDEEVLRGGEVHRQRDEGGVQEHPDAPRLKQQQQHVVFKGSAGNLQGNMMFTPTHITADQLHYKLFYSNTTSFRLIVLN